MERLAGVGGGYGEDAFDTGERAGLRMRSPKGRKAVDVKGLTAIWRRGRQEVV